jgi:glycosyltransferase involved in cell wall biosynthesis
MQELERHVGGDNGVTILIPHFQTLNSIRLCLRSLRKFTRQSVVVRVLDNGSCDESIEYLRSVKWIELVATGRPNDIWTAHYEAINAALPAVATPYFLLMHSDTYVHHPRWLEFLLGQAGRGFAAVGPRHQRVTVRTPGGWPKAFIQHLRVRELAPGVPALRSYCALYATAAYRQAGGPFSTRNPLDITCEVNERLVRAGHRIRGLSAFALSPYLFHASVGTLMEQGGAPVSREEAQNAFEKGASYMGTGTYLRSRRFLQAYLARKSTRAILADDSLDA